MRHPLITRGVFANRGMQDRISHGGLEIILGTVITLIDKRFVFALVDLRAGVVVVVFFFASITHSRRQNTLRNSACYGSDYEECRSLQVSYARYQSGDCLHLHDGERWLRLVFINGTTSRILCRNYTARFLYILISLLQRYGKESYSLWIIILKTNKNRQLLFYIFYLIFILF